MPPERERPDLAESDSSLRALIRGLFGDARDLAVAHVDGLRLEVRGELRDLKRVSLIAAIAVAVFAIASLLLALALARALEAGTPVPLWAAYLIIAAAFAVGGVVLLLVVRRKARATSVVPQRELAAAKRDARWVAQRARTAI